MMHQLVVPRPVFRVLQSASRMYSIDSFKFVLTSTDKFQLATDSLAGLRISDEDDSSEQLGKVMQLISPCLSPPKSLDVDNDAASGVGSLFEKMVGGFSKPSPVRNLIKERP
ncbi:hypothetical protein VNO78_22392 [Psophocarpus tetragonolobus]|uniref:Uncharacterized protein n=1 Tax=Psophocarpus tetragonolobus TaxID=3891 RepID=A0AAN9SGZ8_PSOTE